MRCWRAWTSALRRSADPRSPSTTPTGRPAIRRRSARCSHLHNAVAQAGGSLLLTAAAPPARWPTGPRRSRFAAARGTRGGDRRPRRPAAAAVLVKQLTDRQLEVAADLVDYLVPRMERSFAAARALVRQARPPEPGRAAADHSTPGGPGAERRIRDRNGTETKGMGSHGSGDCREAGAGMRRQPAGWARPAPRRWRGRASTSPSPAAPKRRSRRRPPRSALAAPDVEVTLAPGDITTEAGRAAALEALSPSLLDILVNNAGGPPPGQFEDWGREEWNQGGRCQHDHAADADTAPRSGR